MQFWSVIVSPKSAAKVTIPEGHTLRLTQCSLGEKVKDGRTVLKVTTDGKQCVISSLIAEKMEHCVMELMFEEGEIEFSVAGTNEIHLAGNMLDSDDGDGGHDHEHGDEDSEGDDDMEDGEGGDDEDGEEDEDEESEDEEEEEEEPQASKKRAAPPAAKAAPPAKTAKAAAPAAKAAAPAAKTPATPTPKAAGSATSTPAKSPHAKEISADIKAQIKQVLTGHAEGIKGADFPREWVKVHSTQFKEVYSKAGFKKMTEFIKAAPEVARVEEEGGGNITFFPASKKK